MASEPTAQDMPNHQRAGASREGHRPGEGDLPPAAAAQRRAPPPLPQDEPAAAPAVAPRRRRFSLPAWLVSLLFHVFVLVLLAFTTLPAAIKQGIEQLIVTPPGESDTAGFDGQLQQPLDEVKLEAIETIATPPTVASPGLASEQSLFSEPAATASVALGKSSLEKVPLSSDLLAGTGTISGEALAGRGAGRGLLVAQAGGTPESERAVAMALQWIALHQMPDGGWNFRHDLAPKCRGKCEPAGSKATARIAATGLALLPFLGAGETHQEGQYARQIKSGLYFLTRQMQVSASGGSLVDREGMMYGHGIASIALCEAYAMTRDPELKKPAQLAINFIVSAQDQQGGGWRYFPGESGDTSVVGWQVMALKSAQLSYLSVPPAVARGVSRYLDSVRQADGPLYGYMSPPEPPEQGGPSESRWGATTAIGLLCRMYMGAEKDEPAQMAGIEWLSKQGPSPTNLYYDYYATQVMRHWEGELWTKWNDVMRDHLVTTQTQFGHMAGSWHFDDRHASRGGRLYSTAMAAMILEVYYRYLPIYRARSTDGFPLD